MTHTPSPRVENFLASAGRKLETFEYCFGFDNNQNPKEDWEKAKLHCLIVFLSTGPTRSVSNTHTVLNNLIKTQFGDDVFVDMTFLPGKGDWEIYQKNDMPFMFGNVSHRFWQDYDIILFSVSILQEFWNVPYVLKANGIPLSYDDRELDPSIPPLIFGGVGSTMADILYGDWDTGGCLVDGVYVGDAEPHIGEMIEYFLENDPSVNKRDHLFALSKSIPCFYVPKFYEYDYTLDPRYGYVINKVTPQEGLPETISFAHTIVLNYPGFENKILNLTGDNASSGDIDISRACSGGGSCSFCYEGIVGGKWRERSLDDIVERMRQLRLNAAPNTVGYFSFNLSYYSRFLDLLKVSAERFSGLSLINQRTDVIGADPRYLQLSKLMGLRRASAAVEGMGERIRNNFLNKNLDYEQWKAAARVIFEQRLIEYKVGMIYCGHETQDDMDIFIEEMRGIIAIRDEVGANTQVRVTFTPLVYYPHTPLQRVKRNTSISSLRKERNLSYVIRGLRELGVRSKVNGRSYSTFMEQFLLDFGRVGTKYLVEVASDEPVYYGSVSRRTEDNLFKSFRRDDLDPIPFLNARPEAHMLWCEPVHATNRKFLKTWVNKARKHPESGLSMRQCTTSPANLPKGSEGLKVAQCNACRICTTEDEIKAVVERRIFSDTDFSKLMVSINSFQARYMTVIQARLKPEYFMMSSLTLSHKITALLLQANPQVEPKFHSVGKTSSHWISNNFQRDWVSGIFSFAVYWADRIEVDVQKTIEYINSKLTSTVVTKVGGIQLADKKLFKLDDVSVYTISAKQLTINLVRSRMFSFDGSVPVAVKSMGRELALEMKKFKLFNPSFYPHTNGGALVVALPSAVNPFFYASSLLSTPVKSSFSDYDVESLFILRGTFTSCKAKDCGNNVHEDVSGRFKLEYCPACMSKIIAQKRCQ